MEHNHGKSDKRRFFKKHAWLILVGGTALVALCGFGIFYCLLSVFTPAYEDVCGIALEIMGFSGVVFYVAAALWELRAL